MLRRWTCCPGLGAPQTPLGQGSRAPLHPTPPPLFWLRKELHEGPTQGRGAARNLAGTGTPRPVSAEQGLQVTTGRQVSTAEQARAEGLGRAGQSTWGWDPPPNPTLSASSLPCPQRHPPRASADRPCLVARAPPGTPLADDDEDPSFQPPAEVRQVQAGCDRCCLWAGSAQTDPGGHAGWGSHVCCGSGGGVLRA